MGERNPVTSLSPEDYWTALGASRLIPNSWMTREYVELAGLVWIHDDGLWGWKEEDDPLWVLPPLKSRDNILCDFALDQPIWAGFPNVSGSSQTEELDRQYMYDPTEFNSLVGGRWATFRKNVRKYPSRCGKELVYRRLQGNEYEDEINDILVDWSVGRIIQDHITMIKFVFNGKLRWGLFNDGVLVGLNVGDENYDHVIYRYCLDDGSPFLNEYLRYRFYTDPYVQEKGMVNDGGDLDNEQLAKFKRKLNPVRVMVVYTCSDR